METPLTTIKHLVGSALSSMLVGDKPPPRGSPLHSLKLAMSLLGKIDPYLDGHSSSGPPSLRGLIEETDSHDWDLAYKRGKLTFPVKASWSAGGYEGAFIAMVARSIRAKRVLEVR